MQHFPYKCKTPYNKSILNYISIISLTMTSMTFALISWDTQNTQVTQFEKQLPNNFN